MKDMSNISVYAILIIIGLGGSQCKEDPVYVFPGCLEDSQKLVTDWNAAKGVPAPEIIDLEYCEIPYTYLDHHRNKDGMVLLNQSLSNTIWQPGDYRFLSFGVNAWFFNATLLNGSFIIHTPFFVALREEEGKSGDADEVIVDNGGTTIDPILLQPTDPQLWFIGGTESGNIKFINLSLNAGGGKRFWRDPAAIDLAAGTFDYLRSTTDEQNVPCSNMILIFDNLSFLDMKKEDFFMYNKCKFGEGMGVDFATETMVTFAQLLEMARAGITIFGPNVKLDLTNVTSAQMALLPAGVILTENNLMGCLPIDASVVRYLYDTTGFAFRNFARFVLTGVLSGSYTDATFTNVDMPTAGSVGAVTGTNVNFVGCYVPNTGDRTNILAVDLDFVPRTTVNCP